MSNVRIAAGTKVDPADFARTVRRIAVPVSFTMEDVLRPVTWANVAAKINLEDELIVVREDLAWRLHLLVTGKAIGYVEVAKLGEWVSPKFKSFAVAEQADAESDEGVPDGYSVKFAPRTKWRVLTKNPILEVSRDHATRDLAVTAAIEHHRIANGIAA